MTIMFYVLIHEFSHVLAAFVLDYKVSYINVYPFGTCAIIDDFLYKNPVEELIILISGPLSHIAIIVLLEYFHLNQELITINQFLLLFNMLPIYPLDGSKILMIVFQMIGDLKKAMYMTLKISILSLIVIIVYYLNIKTFMILMFFIYYQYAFYRYIQGYIVNMVLSRIDKNNKRMVINQSFVYRRGYRNYYYFNGCLYDKEHVQDYLLKELRLY